MIERGSRSLLWRVIDCIQIPNVGTFRSVAVGLLFMKVISGPSKDKVENSHCLECEAKNVVSSHLQLNKCDSRIVEGT